MKTLTFILLAMITLTISCKKEDTAPKIITELHGGLYEDGTWTPMAFHKVTLFMRKSNYPLPSTYESIVSAYTDENGKYNFANVDFQSHIDYYLYYHYDETRYYGQNAFAPFSEIDLYSSNDIVKLLVGRAKIRVKATAKDGKKHNFILTTKRSQTKVFIGNTWALETLPCEALIHDTLLFALTDNGTPVITNYPFYTYINDTFFLEINF